MTSIIRLSDYEMKKIWADVWKSFRKTMGWETATQAANYLGIPVWTIINWEKANSLPNLRLLSAIYLKTRINICEIFFRSLQYPTKEEDMHHVNTDATFSFPGIYASVCCNELKAVKSPEVAPPCPKCKKPTTWEFFVRKILRDES